MEQVIPDFMRKYFDESNSEGKEAIKAVASRYEYERQLFFQTTFIHKQQFQRDWNRLTGSKEQLSPDKAIKPLNDKYEAEAKEVATKYAHKENQNEKRTDQKADGEAAHQDPNQAAREQFKRNLQSISARQAQRQPRL